MTKTWSIHDQLALACAVLRTPDANWQNVSSQVNSFLDKRSEGGTSGHHYDAKDCSLQYNKIVEMTNVSQNRTRSSDSEPETPAMQVVNKLTSKRIEELEKTLQEQRGEYERRQKRLEAVQNGEFDQKQLEELAATIKKEGLLSPRSTEKASSGAAINQLPSTATEDTESPVLIQEVKTTAIEIIDDDSDSDGEADEVQSPTDAAVPIKVVKKPLGQQVPPSAGASTTLSTASTSPALKTEEDSLSASRQWKKSIMVVWRSAASHKYANIFMHPVTEDIAPGYHLIIKKPMDLTTIRRNVENGHIRTTAVFKHDMMLMFCNAIVYNPPSHEVHRMAKEMMQDVMHHIDVYAEALLDGKGDRMHRVRSDIFEKDDTDGGELNKSFSKK